MPWPGKSGSAGWTGPGNGTRSVKALRLRYGTAGNKDDRFDAFVLADVLRSDGHRLASLTPDSAATIGLRALVRARKDLVKDLVEHRIALGNQLRANLLAAFPGAVGLFAEIDSPIGLTFLTRFPSAERAAWLSDKRMAAWLAAVGYCGRQTPEQLMAHLRATPAGLTGPAPRSGTAAPASPTTPPWLPRPEWRLRPGPAANATTSPSGTPATRSCAKH
jgi:transposase